MTLIEKIKNFKLLINPKVGIISSAIVVICLAVMEAYYSVFALKQVNVLGIEKYYAGKQVLDASGIVNTNSTFFVQLHSNAISEKIEKTLPYVEKVEITIDYPNNVNMNITPAIPVVAIECGKKYYSVNQSGKILEQYDNAPINLPIVWGYELCEYNPSKYIKSDDELKQTILQELLNGLANERYKDIKYINMTRRTAITMNYDDRVEIRLGSSVDLDFKMKAVKAVIDSGVNDDFYGTIIYNSEESGLSLIPKARSN